MVNAHIQANFSLFRFFICFCVYIVAVEILLLAFATVLAGQQCLFFSYLHFHWFRSHKVNAAIFATIEVDIVLDMVVTVIVITVPKLDNCIVTHNCSSYILRPKLFDETSLCPELAVS